MGRYGNTDLLGNNFLYYGTTKIFLGTNPELRGIVHKLKTNLHIHY